MTVTAADIKKYEDIISPLLNQQPAGNNLALFVDIAQRGWFHQVSESDLKEVKTIEGLYKEVYDDNAHRAEFLKVLESTQDGIGFASTARINQVLEKSREDIRGKLTLYTSLMENLVRPLLSPIYYVSHARYGTSLNKAKSSDLANVGVGKKVYTISNATTSDAQINIKDFILDINTTIRNAGTGHERWEELDNNILEFKESNPRTGAVKDIFTLTLSDLEGALKSLEKRVWILRTAFFIFLENEDINLLTNEPRSKKSIEEYICNWAEIERNLLIEKPFLWDEKMGLISINTDTVEVDATKNRLYMDGQAYDIIYKIDSHPYLHNLLDVLMRLSHKVDVVEYKKIKVTAKKKGTDIETCVYETTALLDFYLASTEEDPAPTPIEGAFAEDTAYIEYVKELRVPAGMAHSMLSEMKVKYPTSTFSYRDKNGTHS